MLQIQVPAGVRHARLKLGAPQPLPALCQYRRHVPRAHDILGDLLDAVILMHRGTLVFRRALAMCSSMGLVFCMADFRHGADAQAGDEAG